MRYGGEMAHGEGGGARGATWNLSISRFKKKINTMVSGTDQQPLLILYT